MYPSLMSLPLLPLDVFLPSPRCCHHPAYCYPADTATPRRPPLSAPTHQPDRLAHRLSVAALATNWKSSPSPRHPHYESHRPSSSPHRPHCPYFGGGGRGAGSGGRPRRLTERRVAVAFAGAEVVGAIPPLRTGLTNSRVIEGGGWPSAGSAAAGQVGMGVVGQEMPLLRPRGGSDVATSEAAAVEALMLGRSGRSSWRAGRVPSPPARRNLSTGDRRRSTAKRGWWAGYGLCGGRKRPWQEGKHSSVGTTSGKNIASAAGSASSEEAVTGSGQGAGDPRGRTRHWGGRGN